MNILLDYESRSRINLKTQGLYRYAADLSTEILCLSWKYENQPVKSHIMGQPKSPDYIRFLDDLQKPDTMIHAHNSSFERIMTARVLTRQEKLARVPGIEQYRCSMLRGLMCGLPGSLDGMGQALGLTVSKDMEGRRLMLRMCSPDKKTGEFRDSPEMRARLSCYCATDVLVESEIEKLLPPIPPEEMALVFLTEKINDLGVLIDTTTALKAKNLMDEHAKEIDARCRRLSGGASGRQVGAMLKALSDMGLEIESLTKKQVADTLKADSLPQDARELLELRQEASKSSTAKIKRMIEMSGSDDRLRGNLMWHGCHTGRYAARGTQIQNMPRSTLKDPNTAIEAIKFGDLDFFKMLYNSPAEAMSSCIRGLLVAKNGKALLRADFSSIEMRVLALLAEDKKTLDDCAKGVDVYKNMASKIYRVPVDKVTGDQRQLGKQAILGAGYQLGPKGFQKACAGYGINIDSKMSQVAIEAYRQSHPEVVELWAKLEDAILSAVQLKGRVFHANKMAAKVQGRFLLIKLISGRKLWFLDPVVREKETPWGGVKSQVHYTGNFMGKPSSEHIYGGSATAMVTQATARDMMTNAMLRLDRAGFPLLFTVHDEIVAEDDAERLPEFIRLMETTPEWCRDFPLKVDAWARGRYGK